MNFPFRPLTDTEQILWDEVMDAHAKSVSRDNISTVVLRNVAVGSLNYVNAMTAATMSIGGVHAPIQATMHLLLQEDPAAITRQILAGVELRVPGWGNSFFKGMPDPVWAGVEETLRQFYPRLTRTMDEITGLLHQAGKMVYPNPSFYSAATAIALDVHPMVAPFIVIAGRYGAWTVEFHRTLTKERTWA